jgi:hypothetical protein
MLIKKLANSKSMFTFLITIVAAAINLALAGAKGSLLYLRTFSGFFLVVFSLGLSFLIVMFPQKRVYHITDLVLATGLSTALIQFISLALCYTPFGMNSWSLVVSIVSCSGLSLLVNRHLKTSCKRNITDKSDLDKRSMLYSTAALSLVLLVALWLRMRASTPLPFTDGGGFENDSVAYLGWTDLLYGKEHIPRPWAPDFLSHDYWMWHCFGWAYYLPPGYFLWAASLMHLSGLEPIVLHRYIPVLASTLIPLGLYALLRTAGVEKMTCVLASFFSAISSFLLGWLYISNFYGVLGLFTIVTLLTIILCDGSHFPKIVAIGLMEASIMLTNPILIGYTNLPLLLLLTIQLTSRRQRMQNFKVLIFGSVIGLALFVLPLITGYYELIVNQGYPSIGITTLLYFGYTSWGDIHNPLLLLLNAVITELGCWPLLPYDPRSPLRFFHIFQPISDVRYLAKVLATISIFTFILGLWKGLTNAEVKRVLLPFLVCLFLNLTYFTLFSTAPAGWKSVSSLLPFVISIILGAGLSGLFLIAKERGVRTLGKRQGEKFATGLLLVIVGAYAFVAVNTTYYPAIWMINWEKPEELSTVTYLSIYPDGDRIVKASLFLRNLPPNADIYLYDKVGGYPSIDSIQKWMSIISRHEVKDEMKDHLQVSQNFILVVRTSESIRVYEIQGGNQILLLETT